MPTKAVFSELSDLSFIERVCQELEKANDLAVDLVSLDDDEVDDPARKKRIIDQLLKSRTILIACAQPRLDEIVKQFEPIQKGEWTVAFRDDLKQILTGTKKGFRDAIFRRCNSLNRVRSLMESMLRNDLEARMLLEGEVSERRRGRPLDPEVTKNIRLAEQYEAKKIESGLTWPAFFSAQKVQIPDQRRIRNGMKAKKDRERKASGKDAPKDH